MNPLTPATLPPAHDTRAAQAAAVRRLLVFHVGSLGDTLVALPALWAVRDSYPQAHRVMLTKSPARGGIPVGRDILEGSGLFDDFLLFDGDHHAYGHNLPRWRKWWGALRLIARLRAGRFDLAVYLPPSVREPAQVRRDLLFFRLAGIACVVGARPPHATGVLEAERLLARLDGSAIKAPSLPRARRDLALGEADRAALDRWLSPRLPPPGGHPWVAFAPGSNLPAKLWPTERFAAVGRALIERHDIWPVVVGGPEDRAMAGQLVQAWGRGLSAAGALPVRQSAALLERCRLFIGNDTGTMHLAASCDVPCVALFSARDMAGKWEPLGAPSVRHQVLRKEVPCAGCMLVRCEERDRLCMRLIEVDEVLAAASALLDTQSPPQPKAMRHEA